MNPVIVSIGSLSFRAFTIWIALGVGAGAAIVFASARRHKQPLLPYLDVLIGGLVAGLVGARLGHVWLNWAYFAANTAEILDFRRGGLDWHGALFGGLAGIVIAARLRRIPLIPLLDALALAVPIAAVTFWQSCVDARCGYGLEVRSLADFPAWLVTETSDIYGNVAPRLNLPPIGIALGMVVFVFVAALMALNRLRALRLWLALILLGLGMALISFFRAEYVPLWFEHRADQVLDLAVAFFAAFTLHGIVFYSSFLRRKS